MCNTKKKETATALNATVDGAPAKANLLVLSLNAHSKDNSVVPCIDGRQESVSMLTQAQIALYILTCVQQVLFIDRRSILIQPLAKRLCRQWIIHENHKDKNEWVVDKTQSCGLLFDRDLESGPLSRVVKVECENISIWLRTVGRSEHFARTMKKRCFFIFPR